MEREFLPSQPTSFIKWLLMCITRARYDELNNQELVIPSLYEAQLAQRLATGPLPDAPARLTGSFDANSGATLEWLDIASGETGYEIRATTSQFDLRVIDTIPANSTSYVDAVTPFNHTTVERLHRHRLLFEEH